MPADIHHIGAKGKCPRLALWQGWLCFRHRLAGLDARHHSPHRDERKMPNAGSLAGLVLLSSSASWPQCPPTFATSGRKENAQRRLSGSAGSALVTGQLASMPANIRHIGMKGKCPTAVFWQGPIKPSLELKQFAVLSPHLGCDGAG